MKAPLEVGEERRLVARAKAGDRSAFAALVTAHAPCVHDLAARVLGDPMEAEDAAQDVFVRAWRGLPRFRSDARLSTWLHAITVRVCYDRLPGLRRSVDAAGDEAAAGVQDASPTPEETVLDAERRSRLYAAVDALPESYRLLVTLFYQYELDLDEVARIVGTTPGAVKVGVHRARARLREALAAEPAFAGRARSEP